MLVRALLETAWWVSDVVLQQGMQCRMQTGQQLAARFQSVCQNSRHADGNWVQVVLVLAHESGDSVVALPPEWSSPSRMVDAGNRCLRAIRHLARSNAVRPQVMQHD